MIIANAQLGATDLRHLINAVPKYPISVKSLIGLAGRNKISANVINFYRVFPETAIFDNEDDILARTEQVEILRSEDQPLEDNVRGSED